jgi:hypothetical protein
MPNHVVNELIFRCVDAQRQDEIFRLLCNDKGEVDFECLVPIPNNVWLFSVGERHEKAFRRTALDWCRENWGTKWNAYSQKPTERTDDTLTLRFETAWRPPYGWLAAVFNTLKCRFEHNWLDEGGPEAMGIFDWPPDGNDMKHEPWSEREPNEAEHRHLHKLQWGVEEFTE